MDVEDYQERGQEMILEVEGRESLCKLSAV
jgi:hypothetical protein